MRGKPLPSLPGRVPLGVLCLRCWNTRDLELVRSSELHEDLPRDGAGLSQRHVRAVAWVLHSQTRLEEPFFSKLRKLMHLII